MKENNNQLSNSRIDSRNQDLLNGLQITQDQIHYFEEKYAMSTTEFLERYAQGEFQHSFDFDEWIGESRMLKRFEEKLAQL